MGYTFRGINRILANTGLPDQITQIKVGTSTTTFTGTEEDLIAPFPINQRNNIVDSMDETTGWTVTNSSISLNTTILKEGTAAINIIKPGTGTFSMSKSTTSRDFTDKEFYLWVYISSTLLASISVSDGFVIRLGSDSSNYYEFSLGRTDFSEGWNNIVFTSSTATTVGSPVITACDYTEIRASTLVGFNIAAGDLVVDFLRLIESSDYFEPIDSTDTDFVNLDITKTFILNSLQANGISIGEIGFFNQFGNLIIREVITPQSKTDTEEFRVTNITEVLST